MNGPKRRFGFTLVELLVVRPFDKLRPRKRGTFGFTLIELLVVIAIIVLLVGILTPTFRDTIARAQSMQCKSNLHSLAQILQLEEGVLPAAGGWVRFAADHGGRDVLACPGSTGDEEESAGDLSEIYIVQNFTLFSNVQDALDTGDSPVDEQIHVNPPGIVGDHGWNPPDPAPNQDLITIDDDGAIMITHGNPIMIESIDPPGDGSACRSEHWVVRGNGSPEWIADTDQHLRDHITDGNYDDRVLMRLTGQNYGDIIDPPAYATGAVCSYGMNNLVRSVSPRLGQLLLVDYGKAVADMGAGGNNADDLAEWVATRHLGKANFVRVDGGVREMTLAELQAQLDRYESGQGQSLWQS